LRQLGQDKQSSATVRYQSSVIGWTVYEVFLILLYKFRFLIYIQAGADTASNTQAAQSPARWLQFKEHQG
jgi:hypothetical protein